LAHTQDKIKSMTARFGEIGETGLERWGGHIDSDFVSAFKGAQKNKTITEMVNNDPVIGAVLFSVSMLIRQVTWRVDAASEDAVDRERAAFADSLMRDMSTSWSEVVDEVVSFTSYGYSYHEIVYKKRMGDHRDSAKRSKYEDNRIGWRKIPIRAQDTLDEWLLDAHGGVQGFIQNTRTGRTRVTIPIEKALLFRASRHKNNPEGRSILRNAFRPWFFKRRIEEIQGIGIERDLAGMPVLYAPRRIMSSSATDSDKQVYEELKKIVVNLRRDELEGVVMPGDRDDKGHRQYELELLSTGGSRQFDIDKTLRRYDQHIAMTVLTDFILLGHDKVGSFALSSSKTDLFALALKTWLDEIRDVFNTHAFPRIFKLNGMDTSNMPMLAYGDIETPDLKEMGEFVTKLSGAGMELFPDAQLENYIRGAANWPLKTQED